MKLGIFGGTFDPPHIGHLIVAEQVREQLVLDKVLFIPASIPPHKTDASIEKGEHRLAMVQLAVRDNPAFEASDIELQRGGVSYTVDTITAFKSMNPEVDLCLLLGMDNIPEFHGWKSPDKILESAVLAVMTRPGTSLPAIDPRLAARCTVCIVPEIGISSSEIRRRVSVGESVRYLVHEDVERYIKDHNLYRNP
jgi:nicotinate-nucleotide adenylyltransferase